MQPFFVPAMPVFHEWWIPNRDAVVCKKRQCVYSPRLVRKKKGNVYTPLVWCVYHETCSNVHMLDIPDSYPTPVPIRKAVCCIFIGGGAYMHDSPCNIRVKWVNVYDCDDTSAYMHPVLNSSTQYLCPHWVQRGVNAMYTIV